MAAAIAQAGGCGNVGQALAREWPVLVGGRVLPGWGGGVHVRVLGACTHPCTCTDDDVTPTPLHTLITTTPNRGPGHRQRCGQGCCLRAGCCPGCGCQQLPAPNAREPRQPPCGQPPCGQPPCGQPPCGQPPCGQPCCDSDWHTRTHACVAGCRALPQPCGLPLPRAWCAHAVGCC
jgi:hypothetical protein